MSAVLLVKMVILLECVCVCVELKKKIYLYFNIIKVKQRKKNSGQIYSIQTSMNDHGPQLLTMIEKHLHI